MTTIIKSLLIVLVLSFSSCSPQYKLNRLLINHPELIKQYNIVTLHDTIVSPGRVPVDTTVLLTISPTFDQLDSSAANSPGVYLPFEGGRLFVSITSLDVPADVAAKCKIKLQLYPDTLISTNTAQVPTVLAQIEDRPDNFLERFFKGVGYLIIVGGVLLVAAKLIISCIKKI